MKRPHRHFCQMRSVQPPEVLLELASTTALDSAVVGGAAMGCGFGAARGCSTMRRGVDCCGGWEGVGSDDFPLTDSPMFGKSRIVGVQYCGCVRHHSGSGLEMTYLGKRIFELALLNVPRVTLTSPSTFVSIGCVHRPGSDFIRQHEGQQAG